MPRKKKSVEISEETQAETPVSELAESEETPETSQSAAESAQEPEKRVKTAPAKAKRQKQVKSEPTQEPETLLIDKRQLILPDAASLFEAGVLNESENKDEQAIAKPAEMIEQTKLIDLLEQTKAELPAELIVEIREQQRVKPISLKFSVSLYERDVEALDQMREYLRGYGVRKLTDSEAIRIAIRATAPSENLIEICEQLKLDDNRRK